MCSAGQQQQPYLQKVSLKLEDLPAQLVHLVARAAGDGEVAHQVPALELEGADVHQAHAVPSLALRGYDKTQKSTAAAAGERGLVIFQWAGQQDAYYGINEVGKGVPEDCD